MNFKIFTLLVLGLNQISFGDMTGKEIMEKQKNLHKTNSEFEVEMMILQNKDGSKETRKLKRYMREQEKDVYRSLLVFMDPSDIKGTALLNWQHKEARDDQWLFMPALKKMDRIAEGGKKNYFMGTDFTYEDLQSEDTNDYTYTVLKKEKCLETKDCSVVEAIPATDAKKKESGYSKRVMWITADNFVTVKTDFYNKQGTLQKTQTNMDFINVSGTIWRAQKGVMDNVKINHKTYIAIADRKINEKIEDKVFTDRFILNGEHTQ